MSGFSAIRHYCNEFRTRPTLQYLNKFWGEQPVSSFGPATLRALISVKIRRNSSCSNDKAANSGSGVLTALAVKFFQKPCSLAKMGKLACC